MWPAIYSWVQEFSVSVEVRQACLSPRMFCECMGGVMREVMSRVQGRGVEMEQDGGMRSISNIMTACDELLFRLQRRDEGRFVGSFVIVRQSKLDDNGEGREVRKEHPCKKPAETVLCVSN